MAIITEAKHIETAKKPVVEDKAQAKKNLKYNRDKEREMVRGMFKFHECPGGTMMFNFKKYKEDPVEKFTLIDGEIYTIPLGVAKHLNTNCWYPVHQFAMDSENKPLAKIGQKVRRCSFQSLEFTDLDEKPDLITVEKV